MAWEVEQIGACTLYRGDCREVLPTLGQVDAVVTDPPYGVGLTGKQKHYRTNHGSRWVKSIETYLSYEDSLENFVDLVLPALQQALSLACCGAVFMADINIFRLPPGHLGGIYLPNGGGRSSWGFQNFMHVVFYGRDPYLSAGRGCRPNGRYGINYNDGEKIGHPCAKPLAAMRWAIDRVSFVGHQALDPFMGSGTTGVACAHLGRSFIGIEIEPRYFDIACRRIEEAYAQPDLFRPEAPYVPQQLALA